MEEVESYTLCQQEDQRCVQVSYIRMCRMRRDVITGGKWGEEYRPEIGIIQQ